MGYMQQIIDSHLQTIKMLSRALDKHDYLSPFYEAENPEDYFLIELRHEQKCNQGVRKV